MKTFLKILGAAALMASVTPYKIQRNEETGEKSVTALLWKAASTPTDDGDNQLSIGVGFYPPTKSVEEEMFADDEMEPVAPMAEPMVVSSEDIVCEMAPVAEEPAAEDVETAPEAEVPQAESVENAPEEA